MEDNEKNRLKDLKEVEQKIRKKSIRESKVVRIFTVILWTLLIVAIVFIIMLYSGLIKTTEGQFNAEFELIYNTVKSEKNKKDLNPYYNYIGISAEERSKKYVTEYSKVKQITDIDINEDFYIIDNTNAYKIGINDKIDGVYLINYDNILVFNLIPYVDKEKEVYILPEILDAYNLIKDVDNSGANEPYLLDGMTPVKYNKQLSKWEITTKDDPQWYNYNEKKWANVILSDYEEDISDASMFVWIPRYAYKISDANHNTNREGIIDIEFLSGNTNNTKNGNTINQNNTDSSKNYVIHPAFKFNNELTGIWVSKYEASSSEYGENGDNYGGGNDSSLTYKSVADRYSWLNVRINTTYIASSAISQNSIYGLNSNQVDSHLMKNTEWGAVAYLAQSKYGRNSNKITINNYNDKNKFKTGYAAGTVNSIENGSDSLITFLWNTANGVKASTTGNVYGVYDLVGGAIERTAAYLNNGDPILEEEALALYQAENKYKDIYVVSSNDDRLENYKLASKNYGDAVFETSSAGSESNSWNKTYSFMVTGKYAFFYRGGRATDGKTGGLFYFSGSSGGIYEYAGFRAVLTQK